ncbi:platelet endothelial aggregation receptor 1-like isoform X2, partial [Biomphalaria glabrata]
DLKPDRVVIEPQQSNTQWLMDNDDTTCNEGPHLISLMITLEDIYPLTWIRIVLNDTNKFSTVSLLYNNTIQECQKPVWSRTNERTMDIRCEKSVLIQTLTIIGNLDSLCSVYINGGRNVAYGQRASQSSNFSNNLYLANSAVDGDYNTFSHTGGDMRPRFSLTFNTNYLVTRFLLYNRAGHLERLRGFRLQSFDANSIVVDNHKDIFEIGQSVYVVIGNPSVPISSLSVNETSQIYPAPNPYVILMETEAYGECPPGKWSLPCTRNCSDSCPTSCHRDDGACNTVCAGFSNPPECTQDCKRENWGINCNNDCSPKCFNLSCDSRTGQCDQGCLGYSDSPLCTIDCLTENWGINCSRNCSDGCLNKTCMATNGACFGGCKAGYQLPDCTQVCLDGQWGINCSLPCNTNCYSNSCHPITGSCSLGCIEGYQLPDCTLACDKVNYGRNCSHNCSVHCVTEKCNATDGSCSCLEGYEGSTCQQMNENSESLPQQTIIVIAASLASGALLAIIICLIVFKVKGKFCFESKVNTRKRKITKPPVIPKGNKQIDEDAFHNIDKHENIEYNNISQDESLSNSNAYSMPAVLSQDEHAYQLPVIITEKDYSNFDIQLFDSHPYEAVQTKKAIHF